MRRRDFVRWAAGGVGALMLPGPVRGGSQRPVNLLIIQTDEHNFRTLGCYRRLLPKEQALMWGPAGWNDIIFMRGTGQEEGWVAAATRRYKLVYATGSDPWLFDLQEDPDELVNAFTSPRHRGIVRSMSEQLRHYGQTYGDRRVANRRIQADLKWAIEGTGPYVSNGPASDQKPNAKQKKTRRKKQ